MTLFLIDIAAKATALLALAGLLAVLLRRRSAATRHLVWTAALVAALLVPVMALSLPRWELPVITLAGRAPATTAVADDEAVTAMAARMLERLESSERATEPDSRAAASGRSFTVLQIIAAVWIGGAGLVIARLLLGLLAVALLGRRTERAVDARWLPLAQSLARGLGISRITFRRSGRAAMPIAWGLWRPTVMMPARLGIMPKSLYSTEI